MLYQLILHIHEVLLMKHFYLRGVYNLGARSAVDYILYSGA